MERMLEAKFALTLCGPALPQAALAAFLSPGGYDSHLRRILLPCARPVTAAMFPGDGALAAMSRC
jgi:hypothetical protein